MSLQIYMTNIKMNKTIIVKKYISNIIIIFEIYFNVLKS